MDGTRQGFCAVSLLILVALLPVSGLAQDQAGAEKKSPVEQPAAVAMEAFGATYPACQEWFDGCQICKRGEEGMTHCSTQGIACRQGTIICLAVKWEPGAKAPKTPENKPDPSQP